MYKKKDYIQNGVIFLNNVMRPRHKKLSTLINTHKGVYEMMQMDRLAFKTKQAVLMGVPLEKLHPCKVTSADFKT